MNKKWWLLITLGLALVLAIPVLTGCSNPAGAQGTGATVQISQQQQGIWVTGTGELSITPDIATLSLGVQAQEAAVSQAQSEATDAMAKVMNSLTGSGIDPKDIQTGHFSISQRTRWDSNKQLDIVYGYQVSNMVTVKIRDTAKASNIIDAVVQAGGDFIRINGINFTVEDPSKYYQQVREMAVTAANNKAKELAKLSGVTLGKPTYVTEAAQYSPVYGSYSNVSASIPAPMIVSSAPPPISVGETKITLTIQLAYNIIQ